MGLNREAGYYLHTGGRYLLIAIPKCASRSAIKACKPCRSDITRAEALYLNLSTPTIAIVRHPWDRLVSAFYSNLRDARPLNVRIEDHILRHASSLEINSHVRPQAFTLRGFWVDHLIFYQDLEDQWLELMVRFPGIAPLEHLHVGRNRPPSWEGLYTWHRIEHVYRGDFELCRDWSG